MPLRASTLQSMRKCIAAPLNQLENATFSLEQGVQEKFSKLFGQSREQGIVKGLPGVGKVVSSES